MLFSIMNLARAIKYAYLISGDVNASLGKENIKYHREMIDSKVDSIEINNDWYMIGKDLEQSIKNYNKLELTYNGK